MEQNNGLMHDDIMVQNSPNPTVSPEEASSIDTSTAVRSYSNATLDVALKYPTAWSVDRSHENAQPVAQVSFLPPDARPMTPYITIAKNTGEVSLKTFQEVKDKFARLEKEPLANYTFSFQETSIGGQKALVVLRSDLANYKEIYLFYNGAEYNITTGPYNADEISAILASIRFTK